MMSDTITTSKILRKVLLFVIIVLGVHPGIVNAEQVLTVERVRQLALEHNRTFLQAKQDVEKAKSDITVARSDAFPEITLNSYYNRNLKLPTFFLSTGEETISFKSGFKNDFGVSLSLRQSIWQGGRVFQAYKIAKLYKVYTDNIMQQVQHEVIAGAEQYFYAAILSQSRMEVLKKAHQARVDNLTVVDKLYQQGLAAKFDLLRAQVEKANIEPLILEAESNVQLAKKQLLSFLGLELAEQVYLEEPVDDTSFVLPSVDELTAMAMKNRPEMKQAEMLESITRRAISVAKADYFPKLEAVSSYSWTSQSDDFTLSDNNVRTWTAGVQLSVPLFNGGKTSGSVQNYQADYQKAKLATAETRDQIRLEIVAAYDKFMEAKNSLSIQKTTIDQAEEGLKIAHVRYESGEGIQLEISSAEAALTDARNSKAVALFTLRTALSNLHKATGIDFLDKGLNHE